MKKTFIFIIAALCCMVSSAQSEVVKLKVEEVRKSGSIVAEAQWPHRVIYKNDEYFKFGSHKYPIVIAESYGDSPEIIYSLDIPGEMDPNMCTLSYDNTDTHAYISFQDYLYTCRFCQIEEAIPFQLVEEKPSFNGGDANEFSKWVNQRLEYPEIAKKNGVQGRVTLQFTIDSDGYISDASVLRGVDPSLDAEALRVIMMSPKWQPGRQRGRAVAVTYTFPVIFQIR